MGILWIIVIGFVAGVIARLLAPGPNKPAGFLLTTGLALALAALNVHLRDVEQILTNGLTLLFFLSPILYPVSTVPTTLRLGETLAVPLRPLYFLNPVAGLVQSYQNIFFFGREPHWIHLGMVTIAAVIALVLGWRVFDRLRDSLAEEV